MIPLRSMKDPGQLSAMNGILEQFSGECEPKAGVKSNLLVRGVGIREGGMDYTRLKYALSIG